MQRRVACNQVATGMDRDGQLSPFCTFRMGASRYAGSFCPLSRERRIKLHDGLRPADRWRRHGTVMRQAGRTRRAASPATFRKTLSGRLHGHDIKRRITERPEIEMRSRRAEHGIVWANLHALPPAGQDGAATCNDEKAVAARGLVVNRHRTLTPRQKFGAD